MEILLKKEAAIHKNGYTFTTSIPRAITDILKLDENSKLKYIVTKDGKVEVVRVDKVK
ncbi:MAG: hypothetical protein ACRCYA_00370 [Cetobacterium sp.]|uniref:hypothetical protein n=1 Tax=Cetobacterium sp. TaxID=2071632 RepID=UPI003F337BCF